MNTITRTFDTIVNHLRAQGVRCLGRHGSNTWYNDKGQACAIGCLVTKEIIDEAMDDGYTVSSMLPELGYDRNVALDFMKVHDTIEVSLWETEFERLALKYEVTYESVQVPA